jgi:transcriptional regulator with XRE-family HTH domain
MDGRALVAWNLRRIRVKRGLSQERLAFDADADRSYVGGLERREENPTVDLLDRLAKTLEVPLSEFFKRRAEVPCLRSRSAVAAGRNDRCSKLRHDADVGARKENQANIGVSRSLSE